MYRTAGVGLMALCCLLAPAAGAVVVPEVAPVPWASVLALVRQMAGSPGTDRGTLGLALSEFMNGLIAYLATHGVPTDALGRIQDRFAWALNAFLNAGTTPAAFGEDVARLARELQALADQGGVQGLPSALLERIGIATWAVEALRHGAQQLTGIEVAAIARQIAGQALARGRAIPQGSPPIPTPPALGAPWPPGPPPFVGSPPFSEPPEEDPRPPRRGR